MVTRARPESTSPARSPTSRTARPALHACTRPARPCTLALGPSGLAHPAHRHAPTTRTGLAGKSRHHSHALQDQYDFTSGCSRHSLLTLPPRPHNAPARPGPVLPTRITHGSHGPPGRPIRFAFIDPRVTGPRGIPANGWPA